MFKSRPERSLRSSVTPFCDAMTAAFFRGPEWVGYHRGWLSTARQLNPIYATTTAVHSRLEFSLETAQLRENSLFKVDTLLCALHRFRDGLAAEAGLAARRHN